MIEPGKIVLDACCGARMMWFDKNNPLCFYADIRTEKHTLCDGRILEITPDMEIDFKSMPFPDLSFKLVVFDPPHLKDAGRESWMAKKYGVLSKDWRIELRQGFAECMRVLQEHGILIFKWSETQIKVSEILEVIGAAPLFGHKSGKLNNTHWMVFMKTIGDMDKE
jgi:ubiquinone/menaquinone biosynthesis C-methylase UbiE